VAIGLFRHWTRQGSHQVGPAAAPRGQRHPVRGEAVATYRDYPARTYARDLVEVRGRVDGYEAKDPDSLIKAMKERFPSADLFLANRTGATANVKP
jgi:hypothetical protein